LLVKYANGTIKRAFGLEPGEMSKIGSTESARRYATRQDGSSYGAH
jgi:hypothetical protein